MAAFLRDVHIRFFADFFRGLPSCYEQQEINSLPLAYFAVSALDILDALDQIDGVKIIDWVYSLQILALADGSSNTGGFGGSRLTLAAGEDNQSSACDGAHIADTYSALSILTTLGDDLSRVSKKTIISSMRLLQQPDGSFSPVHFGAEKDMRFVFCAAAICKMLEDWRGMDVELAYKFILTTQSYDAGFGLSSGAESHGGATYCAVAALKLMSKLNTAVESNALVHWLANRQTASGGYQGRMNKDADSCYGFWVGASMQILGVSAFCDRNNFRVFLLSCQNQGGGFSKLPGQRFPDLLHSYYSLCGFSLLGETGLQPLCCELGLTVRAANRVLN